LERFALRIADLLSETVHGLPGSLPDPQPTVHDIVSKLGPRSFGIVLVLFGLPNLLPVPGLPMVCGVIIGIVALQMLVGRESLALPRWIGERRLKRDDLCRVIDRAEPSLRWLERVMKPRITTLTEKDAQRAIGFMLFLLAIALMAPIPFFGGIPPGIAVILFGLALVERDGLFVVLGGVASLAALVITALLTYAILRSVIYFFA
jgi:hypothetical protein